MWPRAVLIALIVGLSLAGGANYPVGEASVDGSDLTNDLLGAAFPLRAA